MTMFLRNKILLYLCRQNIKKCLMVTTDRKLLHRNFTLSALVGQGFPKHKDCIAKESHETVNKFTKRTHTCGELTKTDVGANVELCGWVEFRRMGKFFTLRDSYGTTQIIIPAEMTDLSEEVRNLTHESVVRVLGTVIQRPEGLENNEMKTGDIEVLASSIEVLNVALPRLPFAIKNFNVPKETLQMQYRYLALRFPKLQKNLRLKSDIMMKMREYLIHQCSFVDVETPTLFRRTPGGAQEFVVPTRLPGKFYSLVQSPQQFKQLLMIGGMDRYFQFARCYRDEKSRSDRQPEFTQLDIEMSFTDQEGIIGLMEDLIAQCWPEELSTIKIPFQRMTFEEAMESYGTDAPDLRIPNKVVNLTDIVNPSNILIESINAETEDKPFGVYATVFSEKQEFLTKSVRLQLKNILNNQFQDVKLIQTKVSGESWSTSIDKLFSESATNKIIEKLGLKAGDVLFLSFGYKSTARQLIGKLRTEFTNIIEAQGHKIRSSDYKFLWIVDFPLFEIDPETGALSSMHHPFTSPYTEDLQYLTSDPLKIRGMHYDLVLNGSEIAGGSIRIHQKDLQEEIFKMLDIETSDMKHLLDALSSGAPPHGGIALGLDRFISLICNSTSIRDVLAFPKTIEGRDLMSASPTSISEEEKLLYNIKTLDNFELKEYN